ncbi:MAG: hypothetical protein ACREOR_03715 [Candidatus Binatia bacterium]
MISNQDRGRFSLILVAGFSLVTGLWAGLVRLGWLLPLPNEQFVLVHGPLMVVGFLGTLIGLERAVALARAWPYGIPILTGMSSLATLTALPFQLSASMAGAASLLLLLVFVALYRQYPAEHFVIMALSAISWLVGNILWLMGFPLFSAVPWWVGFLVLMIGGERVELARIRQPPARVRVRFYLGVGIFFVGLGLSLSEFYIGLRVAAVGLLTIALWLLRYDLAWHSARQTGLPRYIALSLIAGYFWLALGAALWLGSAQFFSAGPRYDAMLHMIFLGFVFSMIFAHAPIILPTITGLPLPFQHCFYLHAGLLHASLLLRVAGDLGAWLSLQRWGGLLNALAVILFLLNNVRAVRKGARISTRPK